MTIVLAPDTALLDELYPLPPGVSLALLGAGEEPGADHLSADFFVFGAELRHLVGQLDSFHELRVVQTLSAGIEMVLPHVPDGVTLCNASGVHDGPVAEWVVAVVLAVRRGLPGFVVAQHERRWDLAGNALTTPPDEIPFDDLEGARVLIIGYGSIGKRVEHLLVPFGVEIVRVALHTRPRVHAPRDLDRLLPTVDVVVLLAPLTAATTRLLDGRRLALLREGAIVVNAARGAMVDTAALERELRAGRLRAALDVTDPEPLPPHHPLWDAPGVIITPHTAGSSRRWMRRAYRFAGDQLRRYVAGDPLENVRTEY